MSSFNIKVKKLKHKKKNKKHVRSRSFLKTFIKISFISMLWGVMLLGLALLWLSQDLPSIKQLQTGQRKPSVTIQTENGEVIATYGELHEEVIKLHELPSYVPQALMAVEDRRFYHHFGIDILGLFRAFVRNYSAGRVVQGGSTITQQLAKNFLFTQGIFPHNDRSYKRKLQEVLLALWLEWNFSKEQILTIYLNRVYLGTGAYGIEAAAQRYFQKSARELSVFEAALIAGLLQAPSKYSPANNVERSQRRATVVLKLMEEEGFIKNYKHYLAKGIEDLKALKLKEVKGYRYFTDWIYESIPDYLGAHDQDIVVLTTLNAEAQQHAEQVVKNYIELLGKPLKVSQAAFLAMRPDGSIVAMVGGKSYTQSQFNRATQAYRQPGSAFKPFVYLTAIERGMTPDTMVDDTLLQIGSWAPKNYKYTPQGQVPFSLGLIKSINSVTIRVAIEAGPKNIIETVQRLGILSPMNPDLSLCLGTAQMTLIELVSAFGAFSTDGQLVVPYGILEIRDKRGRILYMHKSHSGDPVIEQEPLKIMQTLLRRVVQEGTGRRCHIDDTMMAKTGSNGNKDAYFVGYRGGHFNEADISHGIRDVVVGSWVGNDNFCDMHPSSLGANMPLKICKAFLLGKIPDEDNVNNKKEEKPINKPQQESSKKKKKLTSPKKITH